MFRRLVGRDAVLRCGRPTWHALLAELERRADGRRESGAFVLADAASDGRTVTRIVYFDDLDAGALTGDVELGASAFAKLWAICRAERRRVIADVHTHPSNWVCQSNIDQENPMVARIGHLAVILPNLARGRISTNQLGIHRYFGEPGWTSHCGREAAKLIYIGRWP